MGMISKQVDKVGLVGVSALLPLHPAVFHLLAPAIKSFPRP